MNFDDHAALTEHVPEPEPCNNVLYNGFTTYADYGYGYVYPNIMCFRKYTLNGAWAAKQPSSNSDGIRLFLLI
jgi:hypothetical protein